MPPHEANADLTTRRRLRVAAWIVVGVLSAGMFTMLYVGTQHVSTCAGPCDCATPVDRPCR
jgi:hypothetical protein